MKKCIVALILACVCFLSTHAQHSCKDCIYDLYKALGTCQSKYINIGDNTYSVFITIEQPKLIRNIRV